MLLFYMVLARLELKCFLLLGLALAAAPCSAEQQPRKLLQGLGTIRLVPSGSQGRLEILSNGYWGTVCEDGFDDRDANVVCRQLGYAGGRAHWGAYFGAGSGDILASRLDCTGLETSLDQCRSVQWAPTDCDHSEDVSVVCYNSPDKASIHLVGGSEPGQGRLEVQGLDGSWGSVCATGWRHENTALICRQLGYNRTSSAVLGTSAFGWGTEVTTVQMDTVTCSGSERYLAACRFGGWGVSGCDPATQLVGIDCLGDTSQPLPPEMDLPPWAPGEQPQPTTDTNDLAPPPARPPPPPRSSRDDGPPSDDPPGLPDSSPPPPGFVVSLPPMEATDTPPSPPPPRHLQDPPVEDFKPASPDLGSIPPDNPMAAPFEPGPPLVPPPAYASAPPPFYSQDNPSAYYVPRSPQLVYPTVPTAPAPFPMPPGGYAKQPEAPYGGYRPSPHPGQYPFVPTASPPRQLPAGYPLEPRLAAPAPSSEGPAPASHGSLQPPPTACHDAANKGSAHLPAGTLGGPLAPQPTARLLLRLLCPDGTHATALLADNLLMASTFSLECERNATPLPPPSVPEPPSRTSNRQLRVHRREDCHRRRLLRTDAAVTASADVVGQEVQDPPASPPPGGNGGILSVRAVLEDSEGRPVEPQPVYLGVLGSQSSPQVPPTPAVSQGNVRFNCPQGFDSLRAQVVSGSQRWPTQLALGCGGTGGDNWTEPALGRLPVQAQEPVEVLKCPPGLLLTGIVASTIEAIPGSGKELGDVKQPYLAVESLTLYCGSCP